MTSWFLLFFSIHNSFLLAGPYETEDHCERDKIVVETFSRQIPAEMMPMCFERPAPLAPE